MVNMLLNKWNKENTQTPYCCKPSQALVMGVGLVPPPKVPEDWSLAIRRLISKIYQMCMLLFGLSSFSKCEIWRATFRLFLSLYMQAFYLPKTLYISCLFLL